MYKLPTPCQIWGGCCICMQYVPCLSNFCCALQIQPDLWRKLHFKNVIKHNTDTGNTPKKKCSVRPLLCMMLQVQVDGTHLPPFPRRVLGAQGRPEGQSYRLAWTYIVPLAGTDQWGIFIMNTTVLLWSVAKRGKQEEDQKSCALIWKLLRSCISSPTGP